MDKEFGRLLSHAMTMQDPSAEFISPDGTTYEIAIDPVPGILRRIRSSEAADVGMEIINWAPSDERPGSFPGDAPFLPRTTILTMVRLGSVPTDITAFLFEEDIPSTLEEILDVGRAAGWRDVSMQTHLPSFMGRTRQQRRHSMVRSIAAQAHGGGSVSILVIDMPTLAPTS